MTVFSEAEKLGKFSVVRLDGMVLAASMDYDRAVAAYNSCGGVAEGIKIEVCK